MRLDTVATNQFFFTMEGTGQGWGLGQGPDYVMVSHWPLATFPTHCPPLDGGGGALCVEKGPSEFGPESGYTVASKVQRQVIPALARGRDVIAQAPPGTGSMSALYWLLVPPLFGGEDVPLGLYGSLLKRQPHGSLCLDNLPSNELAHGILCNAFMDRSRRHGFTFTSRCFFPSVFFFVHLLWGNFFLTLRPPH